jgi:hypothetical protein
MLIRVIFSAISLLLFLFEYSYSQEIKGKQSPHLSLAATSYSSEAINFGAYMRLAKGKSVLSFGPLYFLDTNDFNNLGLGVMYSMNINPTKIGFNASLDISFQYFKTQPIKSPNDNLVFLMGMSVSYTTKEQIIITPSLAFGNNLLQRRKQSLWLNQVTLAFPLFRKQD